MRPMNLRKNILVITTGGTIESFYDGETPTNVPLKLPTIIPEAIKRAHLDTRARFSFHADICHKDSADISESEIEKIADVIRQHPEQRDVLIVCGTSQMAPIGRKIEYLLGEDHGHRIVFTGAMTPLRHEDKQWRNDSDGWRNLEMAVSVLQGNELENGVYMLIDGFLKDVKLIDKKEVTEMRDINGVPQQITVATSWVSRPLKPQKQELAL